MPNVNPSNIILSSSNSLSQPVPKESTKKRGGGFFDTHGFWDAPLPTRRWVIVVAIACLLAFSASAYLSYVALTSSKIAGCGGGKLFNCGHVISSRWSLWMGIPVSLMAAGMYVGVAIALFVGANPRYSSAARHVGWGVVSMLGISAGMAAVWFISLQVFVLNHLCTYCLLAHACGLVITGVALFLRPVGSSWKTLSLVGFAGLVVLIGGQLLSAEPKTYKIEKFEAPAATEVEVFEFEAPAAAPVSATEKEAPSVSFRIPSSDEMKSAVGALLSPASSIHARVQQGSTAKQAVAAKPAAPAAPTERRLVAINGGTVKLDVTQWPLSGSPSAKYIFVEMFDYSCPHCRHTHAAIKGASTSLSGDMAVIVLPVPLNANCNNTIQVTNPNFNESCQIANLAVAIWRIDPAKFTQFHNWMFEGETAPAYAAAKAYADTLVDAQKLDTEIASGVPAQYIAKTVELYKRAGSGNVPKLIFPTTSVVGEFTSAQSLVDIIKQQIK